MEKIIQLREAEYNQLIEKAKLNELEINQKALELYKEKGTYEVSIDFDCDYSYDLVKFKLRTFQRSKYDENKFKLSFADSEKFNEFINNGVKKIISYKYRTLIDDSEHFAKQNKEVKKVYNLFKIITFFGWFLTLLMFLLLIFK